MEENRIDRKLLNGKPGGRRRIGRPRLRWLDDMEDDLRKMKVKRWRTKAKDRQEWNSIIREAKILNGL